MPEIIRSSPHPKAIPSNNGNANTRTPMKQNKISPQIMRKPLWPLQEIFKITENVKNHTGSYSQCYIHPSEYYIH
jgi:hypothetical protein